MPKKRPQPAQRKPRTDAQRNRERLLEVAKEDFAHSGANTSLDEIAQQAGVGAGTLYRHFPTRDALLEAVYRTEVEKLAAAERKLAQEMAPIAAENHVARIAHDIDNARIMRLKGFMTLQHARAWKPPQESIGIEIDLRDSGFDVGESDWLLLIDQIPQ